MDQVNAIGAFKDIAEAISAKYLANVRLMAAAQGSRPPFNDLMAQLKLMEQELTGQGVKFIEQYKQAHNDTEAMTDNLSSIIRTTIEDFIRQL